MEFRVTDVVTEQDSGEIFGRLLDYNLARIEDREPRKLGVFYEDGQGRRLAGLIGETHGNWLSVRFLWVDEPLRGQRIGSGILEQAERTAKERGCKYAFLDTFGFQAPGFYKKQGYTEAFELEDYPLTGKRIYLTKEL